MLKKTDKENTIQKQGWLQFSIFFFSDCPKSLKNKLNGCNEDDLFVVLPYSCAVVQQDFIKEPFIEVQKFSKDNLDKGRQYGRQPRELQIEISLDNSMNYYSTKISERFNIEHHHFQEFNPNKKVSCEKKHQNSLKSWVTKRFLREAFPDVFNHAASSSIRKIQKHITKEATKEYLEELTGVYLLIDPMEDIDISKEPYEIKVFLIVSELGRTKFEQEFKTLSEKISLILTDTVGLLVNETCVESESKIVLSEYRSMHRIDDYDYLSYEFNHESPDKLNLQ